MRLFGKTKESNDTRPDQRITIIRNAIAMSFKWVHAFDPKEIERVANLVYTGLILGSKGNYDESEKYFYQVAQVHPDLVFAWFAGAQQLFPDGLEVKLIAAMKHTVSYEAILSIHPRDTRALVLKGLELDREGNGAEAIEYYNRGYAINSNSLWLLWNNIRGLIEEKHSEKAIQMIHSYERVKLNDSDSYTKLGQLWSYLDNYLDALPCFDRALSLDPENADALCGKGMCLESMQKIEEALSCFEKATTLHRYHPTGLWLRGKALEKLGRNQEAMAAYDEALRIFPAHSHALYYKARLMASQGEDSVKCLDFLELALKRNPGFKVDASSSPAFNGIREHSRFKQLIS